jgi:ankyrin repeat protein
LESGANPNVINKHTGLMPIHWCARYGEQNNVTLLYDFGSSICIPEYEGHLPIDFAGKFDHWKVVHYLIYKMYGDCKSKIKEVTSGKKFAKNTKEIDKNPEFILNPITRSTILFWASYLDEEAFDFR